MAYILCLYVSIRNFISNPTVASDAMRVLSFSTNTGQLLDMKRSYLYRLPSDWDNFCGITYRKLWNH
jgi:hypothetical protein